MYALSKQTRHQEESDEDVRPQSPPARHSPTRAAATDQSITKSSGDSGGVATAMKAARVRQSSYKNQDMEDQVESTALKQDTEQHSSGGHAKHHGSSGRHAMHHHQHWSSGQHAKTLEDSYQEEDSYLEEEAPPQSSPKAGMPKPGASTVIGAVAVPGRFPNTATQRYVLAADEDVYEDSFVNRSPQIGHETPRTAAQGQPTPTREKPIEARAVADDEADIEAQVQSRMQNQAKDIADMVHEQLMTNVTIPVEVQPSVQDTSSLTTQDQENGTSDVQRKRRICLIVLGLLVIVAAVGAGVGVAVSKKGQDPPPTEACSFCFDASTPPDLETNQVVEGGQSCAEFHESQVQLHSTDPDCAYGQALAYAFCGCPTMPPPPENPTCTVCESGENPLGEGCEDLDTLIRHVGEDPLNACDDLRAVAFDEGCTCPGDEDNNVAAFRAVVEPISGDRLNDVNSPQVRALNWIANVDAASLSVADTTVHQTIKNRYVAAVLYYAFGGEDWPEQYKFLSEGDICTWNQDGLDGFKFGVVCGSDGNVETLRLSENKLDGLLPEEIGYLSGLTNVDMANNTLAGTLPSSLENLSRLQYLNLTLNDLTGTLPEFLFTHLQLKQIRLDDNSFTGSVSPSLGTSSQLQVFWLLGSELTGPIPSAVGQSPVLLSVDLGSNQLTGTIPEFVSTSRILHLLLAGNKLVGSIPTSIGSLSSLDLFSIAGNGNQGLGISGAIPSEIGKCENLRLLQVENNTLAETVPTELGNLRALEELILRNNRLNGAIPTQLGQCLRLSLVDFDNNFFAGEISPVIDALPVGLESFDVGANQLRGTIPTSIGSLTFLSFADFRSNNLNGTIPSEFGRLSLLETLDLASNNFIGSVPISLASLPSLVDLSVYDNDLSGSLNEFCAIAIATDTLEYLTANVCGEIEELECPCCNFCCKPDSFECQYLGVPL